MRRRRATASARRRSSRAPATAFCFLPGCVPRGRARVGAHPVHDTQPGAAGDGIDFPVTLSGGPPPEPDPAAAPPTEPPPATEAAPDEGAGTPAVEGEPA